MTSPQLLTLLPHDDGKMWVAELIGPDETYRYQRLFLQEKEEGVFEIYDGIYQIHGRHPEVSPFNKEYCRVMHGHMERRLDPIQLNALLPEMLAGEHKRKERIKSMIWDQLQEIKQAVPHEQVAEAIDYQLDYLDDLEDSPALMKAYQQIARQMPMIIADYQRKIQGMRGEDKL